MKINIKTPLNSHKGLISSYMGRIKRIPWVIGIHAFQCILILILVELMLGGLLFYQYIFLPKNSDPEIATYADKFGERTYQSILKEWKERESFFENIKQENYPDPFK